MRERFFLENVLAVLNNLEGHILEEWGGSGPHSPFGYATGIFMNSLRKWNLLGVERAAMSAKVLEH